MVRWFKLMGDQYFGFWALGLVLFAFQEIPYRMEVIPENYELYIGV